MGIALTSILEVDTGGSSVVDCREGSSRLIGAGLTEAASFAAERWGMFRISLYRD